MGIGVATAGGVGVLAAVVPAWQAAQAPIAAALRRVG
jgi:ABC-type antimicrobial peptide transport system permease subunit